MCKITNEKAADRRWEEGMEVLQKYAGGQKTAEMAPKMIKRGQRSYLDHRSKRGLI